MDQVAERAGVSSYTIHKLEGKWLGEGSPPLGPSVVTLVKVAQALELPAALVLNAAARLLTGAHMGETERGEE
jgi:hypothetical protein